MLLPIYEHLWLWVPAFAGTTSILILQNRHTVMQSVPAAADGGLLPTSVAWFESRAPVGLIDDAPALL